MKDDKLIWQEQNRVLLKECRVFDLYQSTQRAFDGTEGDFFLLQALDWISVVPVVYNEQGQLSFLMVKQYRIGIKRITIEFPAGIADPQEQPEATARRELLEETGHTCRRLLASGTIGANPAFMNNWIHFFVALELEKTAALNLDEHEKLEVVQVTEADLAAQIGTGAFINPSTILSYTFFRKRMGNPKAPGYPLSDT